MNTMSHRLIRGLIVFAGLSPAVCWAMPQADTMHVLLGAAAVGQDGSTDTQQADDLLRQARKAMAENHLQLADSCISRAETLSPKYTIFHVGDTPAKARADLNKRLGTTTTAADKAAAHGAPLLDKPFSLGKPGDKKAPTDPFMARRQDDAEVSSPAATAAANGQQEDSSLMRLPPVSGAAAAPAFGAGNTSNYPSTGAPPLALNARDSGAATANADPKSQSDSLLLTARKALAVGDLQRANALVEQAKRLQINYGATDDSPARIDMLAHKYASLTAPANRRDTDGYRHQYAALLMEESEGLLRWRELDEAERLASEAQQLPVQYNMIETRPDTLIGRIAEQRRQSRQPAGDGDSRIDLLGVADINGGNSAAPVAPPSTTQSSIQFAGQPAGNKPLAAELTRQARAALAAGDARRAEQLAKQADGMAPDSAYNPQEDRPSLVLLDIQRSRTRNDGQVTTAGAIGLGDHNDRHTASRSIYDSNNDPTRVVVAGDEELAPSVFGQPGGKPAPTASNPEALPSESTLQPVRDPAALSAPPGKPADGATPAIELFRRGEQALTAGNRDQAMQLFRQSYSHQEQLDPASRQRLLDHMQMMATGAPPARTNNGDNLLEIAANRQQVIAKQIAAEVSKQQGVAKAMQAKEPHKAVELLQKTRATVASNNDLDAQTKQLLLRRVDGSLQELQQYVQNNQAQIELDEKNAAVRKEVDGRRKLKVEVGEKLAGMVDEYNRLIDERRFPEAEIVAKRAYEMDPENPVVVQMVKVSKVLRRNAAEQAVLSDKEEGIVNVMQDVDKAAVPFNGEIKYPDRPKWELLTKTRSKLLADGRQHRSPGDLEIEQKLTTPVSLKFNQAPLGEVLHYLSKVSQINLYIDPQGLQAEGVTTDQPVSIDLSRDIQLKSALALILEPLHLSYVIKDEVLKITSEDKRHGQVYTVSYPVADLVIPIPNFGPDGREGISGALDLAYKRIGYGQPSGGAFSSAPTVMAVASDTGSKTNAMLNPSIAAQMSKIVPGSGQVQSGQPQGNNYGPGGQKGGNQADFDSLIELITSTIATPTWTESGGSGSIAPFETNLTLVVSQTQEVHEQIADLLQQLRRLQDLQVTIEVRFITLNDNFFEQIGVNFNFNIPSTTSGVSAIGSKHIPSQVIGIDSGGAIPANGSTAAVAPPVQFRQGSFGAAAVPTFPGLTLDSTPTTFGFAILSDIEAFFLIQAFQGDNRSNVLQAPKVTLFNGQQAFVSDTSQRPFVTSVIPVVGDFAAAQQPVITVLSEGTSLTVQAVVSPDRRFVRLTVVPFFSQIGDVQEFQFTGSKTTTTSSAASKTGTDSNSASGGSTTTTDGTTVQLPTFNFVTVTTTVSVPDGGTVLLGGIKRLSEGRNERGVPVLSKIPYINRLFKNVGIGRTTSSLMMMVTPRIIIQEEEEQKLVGGTLAP